MRIELMRMTKEAVQDNLTVVVKSVLGVLAIALVGCSSGGGGGPAPLPGSEVILEDASILGALITDANGAVAAELEGGRYRFAAGYRSPVMPLTATTKNTIVAGAVSGTVLTYQDVNNNGVFDAAVDVPFNASYQLAYSEDPLLIYFNSVTALIPASGVIPDPAGIAGISRALMLSALRNGLITNTDVGVSDLRRVAAQITALLEAAVLLGAPADEVHLILSQIASVAEANTALNLLTDFSAAITTVMTNNTAVQNLYTGVVDPVTTNLVPLASVEPALIAYAISIKAIMSPSASKNFEAVIKILQDARAADINLASVVTVETNASAPANAGGAVDATQPAIDYVALITAQSEAQLAVEELVSPVADLFLMPVFYQFDGNGPILDGEVCSSCSVGIVDTDLASAPYNVTNFAMTYDDVANSIQLLDDGAFTGIELAFASSCTFIAGYDCFRFSDVDITIEVYKNWGGRRVMMYDYGVTYTPTTGGSTTVHVFPLVKQTEVCAFTLASGASLAQTQLDVINLRNAGTVSCTP